MLVPRLAALVAAIVVAGLPGPALGEGTHVADPAGDVVDARSDGAVAPSHTMSDLTAATIRHTRTHLVVTATTLDLPASTRGRLQVLLIDPRGEVYGSLLAWRPSHPRGVVTFGSDDGLIDCPGLARRIDYAQHTLRVGIPRACFRSPRSVRVSVLMWGGRTGRYVDVLGQDGAVQPDPVPHYTKALRAG